MNVSRRLVAVVAVGSLALTACGSDDPVLDPADEPASAATNPDTTVAPGTASALPSSGPDATIDPAVPEEFLPAIGPVEVIGESLPTLTVEAIGDDAAVGRSAPVLVGLDYDGSTVRIDPTAAGPTMVVFLAHWCPHCNAEIPRINELRDDGRLPAGLNVVAVSTASNPGQPNFPPSEWLDRMDWTFDVMADGIDIDRELYIASDAYGVSGFPFIALVDGNGVVQARWSGERDLDEMVSLFTERLGLG